MVVKLVAVYEGYLEEAFLSCSSWLKYCYASISVWSQNLVGRNEEKTFTTQFWIQNSCITLEWKYLCYLQPQVIQLFWIQCRVVYEGIFRVAPRTLRQGAGIHVWPQLSSLKAGFTTHSLCFIFNALCCSVCSLVDLYRDDSNNHN